MTHNEISAIVLDTAIHVHKTLGPGLLESVYARIMEHELRKRGLRVEREVPVPVVWDGLELESAFRADLIVEDMVVVELKACDRNEPVFKRQVLTYLRLTDKRLGLLINFGLIKLTDGFERIANGLEDHAAIVA